MSQLSSGHLLLLLLAACQREAVQAQQAGTQPDLRAKQDSMFATCQQEEAKKHTAFRSTPGWNSERAVDQIKRQVAYCQAMTLWETR